MTEKEDKVDETEEKEETEGDAPEEESKEATDEEAGVEVQPPPKSDPYSSSSAKSATVVQLTRLNLTGLPVAKPQGVRLNKVQDFSTATDKDETVEIANVRSWHCILGSTVSTILCYAFILFIIPVIGIAIWRGYERRRNDSEDDSDNTTGLRGVFNGDD